MSDNTYSQATTQIIPDDIEAKNQVTTQVVAYLRSSEGHKQFTAGELEKVIEAVENSHAVKGLNGAVQDFVDLLGPKSIKDLEDNPKKMEELAKSIARTMRSQIDLNKPNPTYDKNQHKEAYWNFRKLDQSKYDLDSKSLAKEIFEELKENERTLNINQMLKPEMVQVILSTQFPSKEEINNKQKVIVALAAGMIAKVAGQDTPFQESLKKTKSLPPNVTSIIFWAAVEIANKPEYAELEAKKAMELGKQLGKNARDELYEDQRANHKTLTKILTSKHRDSYLESVVVNNRTIVDRLRSFKRSLSTTMSPRNTTPRPNKKHKTGLSI